LLLVIIDSRNNNILFTDSAVIPRLDRGIQTSSPRRRGTII